MLSPLLNKASAQTLSTGPFFAVTTGTVGASWGTTFPGGTFYRVELSTSPAFAGTVLTTTTQQSSWTFTGLAANATYYAQVATAPAGPFTSLGSTVVVQFVRVELPGTAGYALRIGVGDLDGDGDLDAALAQATTLNETVLRNDGGGTFTQVAIAGSGGATTSLALCDLDSDGDLDILAGNESNQDEVVYRNDGALSFTKITLTGTGGNTKGVACGDYDSDGDLDAVVANDAGGSVVLLRNDGGLSFAVSTLPGTAANNRDVKWLDYDSDGDLDVFVAVSGQDAVLRNDGGGAFAKVPLAGSSDDSVRAALADFDLDGDLDAALSNYSGQKMALWRSDGAGTLSRLDLMSSTGAYDAVWGDYDDDGDADLLFGETAGDDFLARNDGGGVFTRLDLTGSKGNTNSAAWGDFDGDGDLDALLGKALTSNAVLLRNDGSAVNDPPTAPGGIAAAFAGFPSSAALTVTWSDAPYDGLRSTAGLSYSLVVATAPMALAGGSMRVVSPSSFVVAWNHGTPPGGNAQKAAYRVWPGGAALKHGMTFAVDLGGVLGANFKSDATYYFRLQTVDAGLARSTWSAEASATLLRPSPSAALSVGSATASVSFSSSGAAGYLLRASTASDFSGALFTASAASAASSVALAGLSPATTYHFLFGTLWQRTTVWTAPTPSSAATAGPGPMLSSGPFTAVSQSSVTASWTSTFPGGTFYRAELSTSPVFAGAVLTTTTQQSSWTFTGLSANTTYYAQVATAPAGPYTGLGATVTWVQAPSTVYFDEVTTHSIVAAAYAPTPAFTNLGAGLSGTNLALDGVYAGWKGESWATLSAMTTARKYLGACAVEGRLYGVGGFAVTYSSAVESYDPNTNAWTSRASLGSGRGDVACVGHEGRLYALGGTPGGPSVVTVQAYAPASNSWVHVASMSAGRSFIGAASQGGLLYAFGGWSGSAGLTLSASYDAVRDSWTILSPMPVATYTGGAAGTGGRLFYVGGSTATNGMSTNAHRYDPALGSWSAAAPLPVGTNEPAVVSLGGKVFVLGGIKAVNDETDNAFEYDPAVDSWTSRSPLPARRRGHAAAALAGRIHIIGGGTSASSLSGPHLAFDPGVARQFTGLSPNTQYTFKAKARNMHGLETGETASVSTYTLAAVPGAGAPSLVAVWVSSASLAWTANGNPGGTEYRLHASTAADFNAGASSRTGSWQTGTAGVLSSLESQTTWHFRIQARNAAMVPTAFAGLGSTVTWSEPPPFAPASVIALGTGTLSASWTSALPAGTSVYARVSTSPAFAGAALSLATIGLSAVFGGLSANSTYYAQVATSPAGAFSDLGSSVTWVQTPATVYFDEVTTHSIVAAAYAPTPAFTNLHVGLSGTNIALDGAYAGWHGEAWTTKAALATARYGLAAAAAGGKLYAVGGYSTFPLTTNAEYDPVSDAWTVRAAIPAATNAPGLAAYGGAVYLAGGENTGGLLSDARRYDPPSNSWTSLASLPAARAGAPLVAVDGRLQSVGGLTASGYASSNTAYDLAGNAWAARTSLPFNNHAMGHAVVGSKAYFVGGWDGARLSSAAAYDAGSDSWTALSSAPVASDYPVLAAVGRKLYLIGGGGAAGHLASNYEYDPAVDAWAPRSAMPTARSRPAGAALGGRVYVVGGTNGSPLSTNEEYDPGTAWRFGGLAPNTQYSFKAKARNMHGLETGETASVSTYTLAALPGSPSFSWIAASSAAFQWSLGGNPAGTEFSAELSASTSFVPVSSTAWTAGALSAVFTGLAEGTTYHARVRARNAVGIPSAYASASAATSFPAVAGCAATFDVSKTVGFPTLSAALDSVPASLSGETCVIVRDSGTYSERVTVSGKQTNGFRLRVEAAAGQAPVVIPPAGSGAGLRVLNSSVVVSGLVVRTTNAVSYGILVSSPQVTLSSITVDNGQMIGAAGIHITSGVTISHSSVTTGVSHAVMVIGSGNSISFTTATVTQNYAAAAFYFLGAASNSLTDSHGYGSYGMGVYLNQSHSNYLARNSVRKTSGADAAAALFLSDASSNVVTDSIVANNSGGGVHLLIRADGNLIERSTITNSGGAYPAVSINHGRGNRLSRVYAQSAIMSAVMFHAASSETVVEHSTAVASANAYALATYGSSASITGSLFLARNGTGLGIFGSSTTVVRSTAMTAETSQSALQVKDAAYVTLRESSFHSANADAFGASLERASWVNMTGSTVTATATGTALRLLGSSSNTVTASRIHSPSGRGIYVGSFLDGSDMTTTTGTNNSFSALAVKGSPAVFLSPAPGVSLSSSVLEASPGGVSLVAGGLPLVSTFSALTFTGGAYGVDGLSLPSGSRLTMRDAAGDRAGSAHELDFKGQVDWLPDPSAGAATEPCSEVFVVRAAGGGDCTTIQACVDLVPSTPLTGDACVVVADSGSYQEQVVVRNKQAAGHRIRVGGLPSARPTLMGDSTEAGLFIVASDSVTVSDLNLLFPTAEGLVVSSAHARLERVHVEQWVSNAAIVLSSWSTLSDSSVSVVSAFSGDAILFTGIGASVFRATVTGKGTIALQDASSATLSDFSVVNDTCYGLTLARSHGNSVSRGVVSGTGSGCSGLKVFGGTGNSFDSLAITGAGTAGVWFDTFEGANSGNSLRRSTVTGGAFGLAAVYLQSAEAFSLEDSWVHSSTWDAVGVEGGSFSVLRSTLVSGADGRAALTAANSGTASAISDAYLQGSTGAYLNAASGLSVSGTVFVSTRTGGRALNATQSQDLSLRASTFSATGSAAYGLMLVNVDSAAVDGAYAYSPSFYAGWLDAVTGVLVVRSTFVRDGGAFNGAFSLSSFNGPSSSNTLAESRFVSGWGNAATISGATGGMSSTTVRGCSFEATSSTAGQRALSVLVAPGTLVADSRVSNPAGEALLFSLAPGLSLARSTVTASATGVQVLLASFTTVSDSFIEAGTAVFVSRSSDVVIERSRLSVSSFGVVYAGSAGLLTLSTVSVTASAAGAVGAALRDGPLVSTFTAVSFGSGLAVNVDASSLAAAGRVTMRDSTGPRGGSLHESDPASLVDWLPDPDPFVPPAGPGAPTGLTLGSSSVSWSWAAVSGAEGYRVYSSSSGSLLAAPSSTGVVLTGLVPASTHAVVVAAVARNQAGPLSAAATAHTRAEAPTGLALDALWASSATLSWSAGGNPAGTFAELQRSTDDAAYSVRAGTRAFGAVDADLLGCTSYYYRVRNRDPAGVDTAFDGPLLVRTAASTPTPPGDLSAQSLTGRRLQLSWSASRTEGVTAYRLYKDSGTGTVDYSAPYAEFPGSVFSTTTVALSTGVLHRFGLRALHRCGVEETNTHAVTAAWALESLDGVRAGIKVPGTGKRISGNRVLVMAELDSGDPRDAASVRFQYKSTAAAAWTDIPAANANHPNPDTAHPFFVHWDVTGVADGAYDLRAVAESVTGATDPAPGFVTVLVDPVGFEVRETDLGGGKVKKEQAVSNEAPATVAAAEAGSAVVTKVLLPAGALDTTNATLSATVNPAGTPAAPAQAVSLGAALEVTLSNGQTQLAGGQTAALVFHYPDDDGDGVIDGTQVRAERAEILYYDPAAAKWKKEFATTVDAAARTLTGRTPHFSLFAAFGTVATALDAIRVYPNPYKPNGGNADEGRPFSRSDPLSGVIFDNLPASVRITIYTLTGKEVCSLGTDNGTGAIQWDARNDKGEDVATGVYFAVIKSPGQDPVVRKVGVIR